MVDAKNSQPASSAETPKERYERNWSDLLQELRVTLTGTQILLGFLLTIAFSSRFAELTDEQQTLYVFTVTASACAMALLVGPVALHRALFRLGMKDEIVRAGHALTLGGLACLAAAVVCAVALVSQLVLTGWMWLIPVIIVAATTLLAWVAFPLWLRGEEKF